MALALCQASPRRRATRNAPLGAGEGGAGGEETVLSGEGQRQGQRQRQGLQCAHEGVLDSETVDGWMEDGTMDGWSMDGWNGKRTGRNGKKKTDQGWGI